MAEKIFSMVLFMASLLRLAVPATVTRLFFRSLLDHDAYLLVGHEKGHEAAGQHKDKPGVDQPHAWIARHLQARVISFLSLLPGR
jgi:hypothetical protein